MGQQRGSIWYTKSALTFILPGLLLFLLLNIFPIVYSGYVSTTDTSFYNITKTGAGGPSFIGAANYQDLFSNPRIFRAIGLSLLFVATSVPFKILAGLLFASVLNSERVWGKPVLRSLAILPWVVPIVFSVVAWRGMFTIEFGAVNQVLGSVGLQPVNWLYNATNAFVVYNIVEVWLAYPFVMTVLLGAMQNISPELYESSAMDGAGVWRKLRSITLPLIKKPLVFAAVMTSIASLTAFLVPFMINEAGPGRANDFMMVYGYKEAFFGGRYGYASAFMVISALVCAVFIVIALKVTKLTKEE